MGGHFYTLVKRKPNFVIQTPVFTWGTTDSTSLSRPTVSLVVEFFGVLNLSEGRLLRSQRVT